MPVKYRIIPELTPQDIKRFWSKVTVAGPDECWPWKRPPKGCNGRPRLKIKRIQYRASRVAYFLYYGKDPGDLLACHTCDTPTCNNGRHLFLGTNADNSADMVAKNRQAAGDRHGSRTHPERLAQGERHGSRTHPEAIPRGENHGSRTHPERVARGDRNGSRTHPERLPRGDDSWPRMHPERLRRGDSHHARMHPEKLARGEQHGEAKLTERHVKEIRAKYASGGYTHRQLAVEYSVDRTNIGYIINRKTWKHLP